ncbi:MAG TPA: alpha/beta hydrolase [Steroidobacteraceae bacterium]|nr:alpha/beta hydrolase [Steroidobacteraceae bacterium]
MPSLRARLTNAFLRRTVRSMWRPGLDIQRIRAAAGKMDARIGRRPLEVPVEESSLAGVRVTWIGEPALAEHGTLLYIHGGAWSVHLPATYRRFVGALARQTGQRALLIDYRLAPEHPFPAAADDCLAVYRWLVDNGYLARPLAIAGDSAGGNLLLVTLMQARDGGLPMPDCGVALSPATDLTFSGPSVRYNSDLDPMFSSAAIDVLPDLYCTASVRTSPLVSPLFGNWAGLPPLLFHAGSTEALLDDSVRAHDRALQAGNAAEIEVWVGLPHVFHVFGWLPESRLGIEAAAQFITRHSSSSRLARVDATDGVPMMAEADTSVIGRSP